MSSQAIRIRDDVLACAAQARNLLHLIDLATARGIVTRPRIAARKMSMPSLRFERDGTSLRRSEAGIDLDGPLAYSVTRHEPVIREIVRQLEANGTMPRILDDADEVVLDLESGSEAEMPSLAMMGQLHLVMDLGFKDQKGLASLSPGFDSWSAKPEVNLRIELRDDVSQEIEDLPPPHRRAAIAWCCRLAHLNRHGYGIDDVQGLALARQQAVIAHQSPAAEISVAPGLMPA